ncbi:MAG: redoxin domain-containing protein [Pseudomonadota bacterium]
MTVNDFTLLDQHGEAHSLHYHRDATAIVLIVQGNGCQIVRNMLPDYRALREDYAHQGVRVFMINSNLQDERNSIAEEAVKWDIDFPILVDSSQAIGRSLKLTRTNEVIVINPYDWRVVYRGALNNRVAYERQKTAASEHYVRSVLDNMIAGETPAYQEQQAPGCIINFLERDGEQISYADTVAPILIDKCTACHVENGIAPWAMSEYRMVLGFAPMISEVLRTRRMPPWHVDPEIGEWEHDAGLSVEEKATVLAWLEAGAPRGEGPDPLLEISPRLADWTLGEPDLILEVPAFDVPATGTVDYQFPQVQNPLGRDAWVVAATIIPGDQQAVHHVLMGTVNNLKADGKARERDIFENYIMGYAPGNESAHMPSGTGVFVGKDAWYTFQMHYTPYGRATTDRTRVGLYFADEPPAKYFRQQVVVNPAIRIPPGAPAHEEKAYFEFEHDAIIYNLTPHAHYRGKSSTFELVYPEGNKEVILSVPDYDFNWQRTYSFVEPKTVPAGTRIVHRTVYDNSAKNPGNPNPKAEVLWGLQSEEEMLYGSVSYVWTDESANKPFHSKFSVDTAQYVGFMDQDMDGKIARGEMPDRMREKIGWKWWFVDKNWDGGLDQAELEAMFSR